MERKIYVVRNYDAEMEKLVKLTLEQAKAIEWFFNAFEIDEYNIDAIDEKIDIDAP